MQNFFDQLKTIIPLCIASGSMAITVSKGSIFKKQRLFLNLRMPWLGKLFSCPYCLSHWIIILVMITYSPILVVSKLPWVDWIISGFCLVGITSIQIGIVLNLIPFKPDLTDDEVSLVKKMSDALRTAKGLIQQKEEEIDALKKKLEG